ncbi:Lrp/AsnC family transcriptional regulator [Sedimentitalea sp.]|uniref:siroheme decarboxylase subunit beta n=1 Tax=Sedimentitalea sp. TaxID=2048915 RepID=UPI003298C55F
MSVTDRDIVSALQGGLPLVAAPYAAVAASLGVPEQDLLTRLEAMQASGVIRRIAVAPNHFKLGMTANGMTVWDVEDARVADLGALIGALPFVTHSYERPRALPDWPYNLFAMVHGTTRDEVEEKRQQIAAILGAASRANDILYSTRILKKTGLRLRRKGPSCSD